MWAHLALMGASALGGLLGNKKQTQESNQTANRNTDMYNMPVFDGKSQSFRDNLINRYMFGLEDNEDYFKGYTLNGLRDINSTYDAAGRNIENLLASRGIRGGAGVSALAIPQAQRAGASAGFLNSIPQLIDQRNQQLLQQASGFMSSLPVGQHNYGNESSTTKTVGTGPYNPANPWTGALTSAATVGAGLFAQQQQNQSLAGLLARYAGQNQGSASSSYIKPVSSWNLPKLTQ